MFQSTNFNILKCKLLLSFLRYFQKRYIIVLISSFSNILFIITIAVKSFNNYVYYIEC